MSQTTYAHLHQPHYPTPRLSSSRERLLRASDHLWRVQDKDGHVLGHLRIISEPRGIRYRAERLQLATGSFRLVGDFWNADDAVYALRNG
jgi:hypothetical protein